MLRCGVWLLLYKAQMPRYHITFKVPNCHSFNYNPPSTVKQALATLAADEYRFSTLYKLRDRWEEGVGEGKDSEFQC